MGDRIWESKRGKHGSGRVGEVRVDPYTGEGGES
jgi:hypothetical protein